MQETSNTNPILASIVALAAIAGCSAPAQEKTTADGTTTTSGGTTTSEVKLCDNHTTVTIDENMERNRENGQAVASALMSQWSAANPERDWKMVEKTHPIPEPHDNKDVLTGGQVDGQVYGQFSERDVATWSRETKRLVLEGARVFHNADELGSTVAVSCDMCHPDAANTHPETYPKFQTQLGRVVLMRDMINWCLEHPVRAPTMEPDDPRMRAMEAYILARRKGTALDYGKH